jgi:hypothetical protein
VGRPEVGKLGEQIVVRTYPVVRDLPICEDSQEGILDVVGQCSAIAREGRGTCLPGLPRTPHDEPGCFDQVFLQFIKDSMAGRTPNVQSVGISYMYGGFWVPNKSHAMGTGDEFHVGPHIMIIGPDQKMLETLNHYGSNGEPYVNHLPGRTELYLVIPIREWDDAQAARTFGAAHR